MIGEDAHWASESPLAGFVVPPCHLPPAAEASEPALWHTALCGNDGPKPLVTFWCAQGLAWAEGMAQVFDCSRLGTGGHVATSGMVLPSRHSFTNLFLLGLLTWRLVPEMGLLCLRKGRRTSGDPQLPRNALSICLFIYF